ncbi:MAG TPA: TIGR00269 family protein, partial [Candidatus Aenigmarchaeota archaeon]|nr:TIGR00269 family protein [Candidatus Aenigmarchaeota archaeon]
FIPRIKPLREIPERECAVYSLLNGFDISWKKCPYISGVRIDIKKFINYMENKYPGIKYTILYTFDKMIPGIRKAASGIEGEIKRCKICGEPCSGEICKTCELWNRG